MGSKRNVVLEAQIVKAIEYLKQKNAVEGSPSKFKLSELACIVLRTNLMKRVAEENAEEITKELVEEAAMLTAFDFAQEPLTEEQACLLAGVFMPYALGLKDSWENAVKR